MADEGAAPFKLQAARRVTVPADEARAVARRIFAARGCGPEEAAEVADHLVEADLCGIESHGMVRVLQYAREYRNGLLTPGAPIERWYGGPSRVHVEANGGIGIRAMRVAVEEAVRLARGNGLAMATLTGAGHTGRLGAFAERAAMQGCLTIALGGGDRKRWRMVTPHGGRRALLPTNPYCIGVPGGDRGPVVLDFATAMIAGGWIYAAREAGAPLPPGAVIDRDGAPTVNPQDYFDGGAILPKGGHLGSGLALIAELVGEAMLGPVRKGEINWLALAVDCEAHAAPEAMQAAAEEILAEIRDCPPARGGGPVEAPGERERDRAAAARGRLFLPEPTWQRIMALASGEGQG